MKEEGLILNSRLALPSIMSSNDRSDDSLRLSLGSSSMKSLNRWIYEDREMNKIENPFIALKQENEGDK